MYDVNQQGYLDYKMFVANLFNTAASYMHTYQHKSAKKQKEVEQHQPTRTKQEHVNEEAVDAILLKIQKKLISRGVRGIISIAKSFRVIDDNNSHSIDFDEFRKAAKDFRFDLTDYEIEQAFVAFDRQNTGYIDYEEFLRTIRGNMNDKRKALVLQAFNILDKTKSGVVDIEDIKLKYNAKNHPDVQQGKKTEDEVILEFLETFESNHSYLIGENCDGKVTPEEFIEYYENVSMSIDDDEYFEVMMNNAWRMNANTTANNERKGWSSKDKGDDKKKGFYVKKYGKKDEPYEQQEQEMPQQQQQEQPVEDVVVQPLDKLRDVVLSRGPRSIIGLARQFKVADRDSAKALNLNDFARVINDFKVGLTDDEVQELFVQFDKDNSNEVNYEEMLHAIRGEMNEDRLQIVQQAFNKLDIDKSGIIEINDIKSLFNSRNNREVLEGKKNEEDVYEDFVDTFDSHHFLKKGYKDKKVTLDEFIDYYENISMFIDNDEQFIESVSNAWKIYRQKPLKSPVKASMHFSGQKTRKGRMIGEYSKIPGTFENAPFGVDKEPTSYLTSNGVKQKAMPTQNAEVVQKFREKTVKRGMRGIMSIRRAFVIGDENKNNQIEFREFAKLCYDYRIGLNEGEIQKLFEIFDKDNSGVISYEEFLDGIVGQMNQRRESIVQKAFNKLDLNDNGYLDIDETREAFNTRNHPDVLNGRKTEDEVLGEFIDTFDYHFDLLSPSKGKEAKITLEEFMKYYNYISMGIPDDQYFEAIVTNAWNLDNKPNYGKAWGKEIYKEYGRANREQMKSYREEDQKIIDRTKDSWDKKRDKEREVREKYEKKEGGWNKSTKYEPKVAKKGKKEKGE